MKEKIAQALKAKFPNAHLSKKRLETIVAKIEEKVAEDETKIDAAIDLFNEYNSIEEISKADDKQRTIEAELKKSRELLLKKEGAEPPNPPKEITVDDDAPSWAKLLIESNKKLSEDLEGLKKEKNSISILESVSKELSKVPKSFWGERKMPEKNEDVQTFIEKVNTDYTAFQQQLSNEGLATFSQKPKSGVNGTPKETATKEEIQDVVNLITT